MKLKFIQNASIENILQACGSTAKFSRLIYPKFDFENLNKVDLLTAQSRTMKYYLVNYILLNNKVITSNENIGISLYSFANIEDFKQTIAARKLGAAKTEQVVIKSYKQISLEAYNCLNIATL